MGQKLLSLFLCAALLAGLSACAKETGTLPAPPAAEAPSAPEAQLEPQSGAAGPAAESIPEIPNRDEETEDAEFAPDIQPNTMTKRLNVRAGKLRNEYHIRYTNTHSRSGSRITLTLHWSARCDDEIWRGLTRVLPAFSL